MTYHQTTLDSLFGALADATRRDVLAQLATGPASVTTLAQAHEMALPSFLAHIQKLEVAGLIASSKDGRVRTCAIVPEAFDPLRSWLDDHKTIWDGRLDRLEDYLTKLTKDHP